MEKHDCVMIEKIERLIVTMEQHVLSSEVASNEISALLKKHDAAIYGNGEQGLKTKLALLEADASKREKYQYMAISSLLGVLGIIIVKIWENLKG